jgi:hypothetical protein
MVMGPPPPAVRVMTNFISTENPYGLRSRMHSLSFNFSEVGVMDPLGLMCRILHRFDGELFFAAVFFAAAFFATFLVATICILLREVSITVAVWA